MSSSATRFVKAASMSELGRGGEDADALVVRLDVAAEGESEAVALARGEAENAVTRRED